MSWGIHPNANEKEKIKAEMGDTLTGLNSVGALDYDQYNETWDQTMKLFDEMYELGKKDALKEMEK